MSIDSSKYKITTVKMVYATQVITSNEENDYPSPSQFEQWKLDTQVRQNLEPNLKLPPAEKPKRTKNVPEYGGGSSRNGGITQSGLIPVRNYLQSMEMVSETPEREIIDERTKRCHSEQPKTLSSRTSGNVVRSNSDRPQVCDKPANVSRCDSVEPNLIKSSTTSLASLASDIVVVSAGWFSSLRRPGKKRRKQEMQNSSKAKSAWDLSNLGKMVCFYRLLFFFICFLCFVLFFFRFGLIDAGNECVGAI